MCLSYRTIGYLSESRPERSEWHTWKALRHASHVLQTFRKCLLARWFAVRVFLCLFVGPFFYSFLGCSFPSFSSFFSSSLSSFLPFIHSSALSFIGIFLCCPKSKIMIRLHEILFQDEKMAWLTFQKRKWEYQAKQRAERKRLRKEADRMGIRSVGSRSGPSVGISSFIRQQAQSLLDSPWQIIQVSRLI